MLINTKTPRVPMLFLVGQTEPLPPAAKDAIAEFAAAGGKVFADADSADWPNTSKLPFGTHGLKSILCEGYASDAATPLAMPVFEKLAAELKTAAGQHRRFPVDCSDPWVARACFDGGPVRYIMVANETSPYAWGAGTVWSLGAYYCYLRDTHLPKVVTLSFPFGKGVIYDVFEQRIVKPSVKAGTAKLDVDLRTFPGRLYAIAPAELGPPRITAGVIRGAAHYKIEVVDRRSRGLAASAPLRIALMGEVDSGLEIYRGSSPGGIFTGEVALPPGKRQWTLTATELLSGKASAVKLPTGPPLGELVSRRRDVPIGDLTILLGDAKSSGIALVGDSLTAEQRDAVVAALKARGIEVKLAAEQPQQPTPGVFLAANHMQRMGALGEMLHTAWSRGMFPCAASRTVPGPGRGIVAALYAPRGFGEDVIGLVGGDPDGLNKTVDAFIAHLRQQPAPVAPAPASPAARNLKGKPADATPTPRLTELAGARLSGVAVAADGEHLAVTADGYLRNVALVEDKGRKAKVIRTARIGQGPSAHDVFVSDDGALFGASARVVDRIGQGFHLIDAESGSMQVFAAFGDMAGSTRRNRFAASADGNVIIAPGTHGVVCWRRDAPVGRLRRATGPSLHRREQTGWKEAWAIDYWKEFDKLDWPLHNEAERRPQFDAVIPSGADYALILFNETGEEGLLGNCTGWLAALSLGDGRERWRFDVPTRGPLPLAKVYASPDGSRCLLQASSGGSRGPFRLFSFGDGKLLASWDSRTAPQHASLSSTGSVVAAYKERLVEIRLPDGSLICSTLWHDQPVSVALADDGKQALIADDGGWLTCLDVEGSAVCTARLGCVSSLAVSRHRIYAAGRDGRLRCLTADGKPQWTLDLTPAMLADSPMAEVAASAKMPAGSVIAATRPPTASSDVPPGENMLKSGGAKLILGGIGGWMSGGSVQIKPEQLTNGKLDDVATPWLHVDELYWDGFDSRQVYAEIAFPQPTAARPLSRFPPGRSCEPTTTSAPPIISGLYRATEQGVCRLSLPLAANFPWGPTAENRAGMARVIEQACYASGDPVYAWFLSQAPGRQPSLLYGEAIEPGSVKAPSAPSTVFPEAGIAMLRADESPDYWTNGSIAVLQMMGQGYGHQHNDKMMILMHAGGRLLYPDFDPIQYESANVNWTRSTIAHNTLVVDRGQTRNSPSTYRHEFAPDVKFLATTASCYEGVQQTRALALTREYLLDLFWADSDVPHTYDWVIHAIGKLQWQHPALYQPSRDLMRDYWWVENETARETGQAWRADFVQKHGLAMRGVGRQTDEWFNDSASVRLTMIGEPGTTVYGGDGPSGGPVADPVQNPGGDIPLVVARREAHRTVFAAVHEPYKAGPPAIADARKVAASRDAYVAVVHAAKYTDHVAVAFGEQKETPLRALRSTRDPGEVFAFRSYGYLRESGGTLAARGNWVGFRIRCPGLPAQGGLTLNGKKAAYRKEGEYVLFGDVAAAPKPELLLIAVETPLPEWAVPGQDVPAAWTLSNTGAAPLYDLRVSLSVPAGCRVNAQAVPHIAAGEQWTARFLLRMPAVDPGDIDGRQVTAVAPGVTFRSDAGHSAVGQSQTLLLAPPMEVTVPSNPVRLALTDAREVSLRVTNWSPAAQPALLELRLPEGIAASLADAQRAAKEPFPGIPGPLPSFFWETPAIEAGRTVTMRLKLTTNGDAKPGLHNAPLRAGCTTAGREAWMPAVALPITVGPVLLEDNSFPAFGEYVIHAPRYTMRVSKLYGTARFFRDDADRPRCEGTFWDRRTAASRGSVSPDALPMVQIDGKPMLAWGLPTEGFWTTRTPAAFTVLGGGSRITSRFEDDAVRIEAVPLWSKQAPHEFVFPGVSPMPATGWNPGRTTWTSWVGEPEWVHIIAADDAGAERDLGNAPPREPIRFTAAMLRVPGYGEAICFMVDRPQPVRFEGARIRFSVSPGEALWFGLCREEGFEGWRKGRKKE